MEEKLQFVPSLKDAFAIGVKNLVPIVLSVLLWLVTVWIPYVNPKSVIRISLCRTAKRNPLIFPI